MLPEITLRLAICANSCPIGPRIQRGEPLPPYQHTYALKEARQAKADMEKVRKYIERNHNKTMKGRK